MHTESERGLRGQFLLDVFDILLVGGGCWALESGLAFREGEHVSFVKERVVHQVDQETTTEDSIDIIDDVTTVHDITEDISEIIPRDLSAGSTRIEIVLKDNS